MGIESILVVDDEPLMREFLGEALKRSGYQVDLAENGKAALQTCKKKTFDLVITDLKMPDLTGIALLEKIKERSPSTLGLVMTAHGTIETAVEAMKKGAFHYLLKPFTPDALEALLKKAEEHQNLMRENSYLREEVSSARIPTQFIATSPAMKKIFQEAIQIAKSSARVLIHGESGTGKEVVAATIHAHSLRAQKPYIRVNCAAVPDTLIESEFFGHEKGAFTGANSRREGRFELAHEGTLLLDEVTEIPITLQPKLLRVIQEQEFERVGGSRSISVDVRLISTSNRNLQEAISEKLFREDLYYRLNVVPIHLPPLRERREDLLPLANYFLEKFCTENGSPVKKLSKQSQKKILDYHWPGNIRELANMMERVVVLNYGPEVEPNHFSLD
ncbi:MAG: Transcriptional regulatory protein ZraR [Chlamydiae bacterium]|nr:Transcriptional regulatory protein ZraR [Chlamydiota bacterium]